MIIYCITNLVNGKRYVGQTIRTLEQRFKEHCNNSNSEIGRAIQEYGVDNFKAEIVEQCETLEHLNVAEQYWISKYNCRIPNGYNIREGGQGFNCARLTSSNNFIQNAKIEPLKERIDQLEQHIGRLDFYITILEERLERYDSWFKRKGIDI